MVCSNRFVLWVFEKVEEQLRWKEVTKTVNLKANACWINFLKAQ
jgi:hypothetical protein